MTEPISNYQPPIEPQTTPPEQLPQVPQIAPKKSPILPIMIGVVIFILVSAVGYLGFQVYRLNQIIIVDNTPSSTPDLAAEASAKEDSIANWKTYVNKTHAFELKIPSNWPIDENSGMRLGDRVTIYVSPTNPEDCRGDCNVITKKQDKEVGRMSARYLMGWWGDVGGNTAQSFASYVIPLNNEFLTIQLQELPFSANPQPGRTIADIPPAELMQFDQILGTFKFTNQKSISWKTYTNPVRNYSIQYPSDWLIDSSKAEISVDSQSESASLTFTKGDYKLSIIWPSAYGPNLCVFDDESRSGAPEMAGWCEGKFIQFKNGNNSDVRRLENPEVFADHVQWEIYTRDQAHFVTIPPTRYTAPKNYSSDQITTMDKIIESYKEISSP